MMKKQHRGKKGAIKTLKRFFICSHPFRCSHDLTWSEAKKRRKIREKHCGVGVRILCEWNIFSFTPTSFAPTPLKSLVNWMEGKSTTLWACMTLGGRRDSENKQIWILFKLSETWHKINCPTFHFFGLGAGNSKRGSGAVWSLRNSLGRAQEERRKMEIANLPNEHHRGCQEINKYSPFSRDWGEKNLV